MESRTAGLAAPGVAGEHPRSQIIDQRRTLTQEMDGCELRIPFIPISKQYFVIREVFVLNVEAPTRVQL